jgi:hypothetical protein
MNKKSDRARIIIDVEKITHKELKKLAIEEDKSLRALMLEAIERLLKERTNAKNTAQ